MTDLTLFYVVFISQIILLSAYFPLKMVKWLRFIQREYPASSHPKLYPKSQNYYRKITLIYGWINALIFILGWVIVYYIYEGSLVGDKGVNLFLPWVYFMIQEIPALMLEVLGLRMSKLMKQADNRTKKSADLAPRHIFQYISPLLLSVVVIVYIGVVVFGFYLEGFKFEVSGKAFPISVILLVGYGFFFSLIAWLIYGKKCDPYQSQEDRIKSVSLVINIYCYTLIACALFMAFSLVVGTLGLKSLMPIAMSVFLQFLVAVSLGFMLQKNRLEGIDFDVYKSS